MSRTRSSEELITLATTFATSQVKTANIRGNYIRKLGPNISHVLAYMPRASCVNADDAELQITRGKRGVDSQGHVGITIPYTC
jgi:hypothetical protein